MSTMHTKTLLKLFEACSPSSQVIFVATKCSTTHKHQLVMEHVTSAIFKGFKRQAKERQFMRAIAGIFYFFDSTTL